MFLDCEIDASAIWSVSCDADAGAFLVDDSLEVLLLLLLLFELLLDVADADADAAFCPPRIAAFITSHRPAALFSCR